MRKVYIASSALIKEDFDGVKTIEQAVKHQFDGVQLFLDSRYRDSTYRQKVVGVLKENPMGAIFHLPNVPLEEDLKTVIDLHRLLPDSRFLLHYLPTTETPNLPGVSVGWENSGSGFIVENVEKAKQKAVEDDTFFVLDIGRMSYAKRDDTQAQKMILDYFVTEIKQLNADKDVLHLNEKTDWELKRADCESAVGDGILNPIMNTIKAFQGLVVLECEDFDLSIQSLQYLRS